MTRSDQIDALAAALVAARPKFKPLKKSHTAKVASTKGSYQYTYSTLEELNDSTVQPLADAGLVASQNIEVARDLVSVSTFLLHASGQFIHYDPVSLPGGSTPQSVGSAITYARRYSLQAALGIAAEDDDDGQRAAAKPARPASAPAAPSQAAAPAAEPMNGDARVISDAQRKQFFAISKGKGWTDEDVKKLIGTRGYTSSKDIRVTDYDALVKVIETGELADDNDPPDYPYHEGGVQ